MLNCNQKFMQGESMKRKFSVKHKRRLKEAAKRRWANRKAKDTAQKSSKQVSKPSILERIKKFFGF